MATFHPLHRPTRRSLPWLGYGVLAAVVMVFAVAERVRLPPPPFIDGDTWGYLHPALSRLTGGPFQHSFGRDFVYPGFVYLGLRAFGDFRAITMLQHALGVLTGGLMVWSWARLGRLLRGGDRPLSPAAHALGLLTAAVYVTARSTLRLEHSLRPEAVFPFFVFVSILLSLEFITHRWVRSRPDATAAAWLGGAGIFVSVLLYHLKPSFGLATVFANGPLLVSLAQPGMTPRRKLAMTGGGVLLAGLLLTLPETLLSRTDPRTAAFLPNTLLTVHADLIRDQLAEDLARGQPLAYPRERLAALHDRLDALLAAAARPENAPYRSLGFNPDYLFYTDYVFKGLVASPRPVLDPLAAEMSFYYYRRVVLHHPARMLGKIGRQLGIFYGFRALTPGSLLDTRDPFRGEEETPVAREYAANLVLLRRGYYQPSIARYPPARRFETETEQLTGSPATISQPPVLSVAQNVLTALYLPVLIVWLCAAGWTLSRPDQRNRWRLPTGALLLVYGYNFGNCLTIAVVHSLDVDRYVSNQLAFTLFSSAAGLLCLGLMGREAWEREQGEGVSPGQP